MRCTVSEGELEVVHNSVEGEVVADNDVVVVIVGEVEVETEGEGECT